MKTTDVKLIYINVPFMTREQFAKLTGWSVYTINKLITAGKLEVFKRTATQQSVVINLRALEQSIDNGEFDPFDALKEI